MQVAPSTPKISEPWRTKATRRKHGEMAELRGQIYQLLDERNPQTVRQLFYAMVSRGLIDKTEHAYKNVVVRVCGEMRESGDLPWEWIIDSTRSMRKPSSYSSPGQALEDTAAIYRRDLWGNQSTYIQIWCEKEALAEVLLEITWDYDVPLMVARAFRARTLFTMPQRRLTKEASQPWCITSATTIPAA